MWELPLLRTKVTNLNKWLPFHCQPSFHVWNLATGQPPYLIPCFNCELETMRHVSLPKKGEPGAIMRLNMLWFRDIYTNWLSPGASGAGAAPMPLTISMHLFSGVETPRNGQSEEISNHSCFVLPHVIPMALWPHCSLPKNSFLYSVFKGGLWITSAPNCEAWWLKLNSQSAGTQRCLALSCVSVLFLQPDS